MHTRQLQQCTQDKYNNKHKTTTIHTRQLQQYTQDNYNNTHKITTTIQRQLQQCTPVVLKYNMLSIPLCLCSTHIILYKISLFFICPLQVGSQINLFLGRQNNGGALLAPSCNPCVTPVIIFFRTVRYTPKCVGRGSSVGIATRYGMDGPGI